MIEVADIFQQYGPAYRNQHSLSPNQGKAMKAIEMCRTSQLGGHVDQCGECGHTKISYNSCRNRHCPKCQNLPKERWLEDRKQDLLPIAYFHVVFTLPDDLNAIALQNQQEVYNLLFRASAETLQELTRDCSYLGAEIGFISILHTWGQNLMYHPHVHCIVTGGGLSLDGTTQWVASKPTFFLPVKVMSRLFRGKFLAHFKKSKLYGSTTKTKDGQKFSTLLTSLYNKEWVVYCKPPFQSPEHVLSYLGRYTHKVAISNHRICGMDDGKVTFKWRDYKDGRRNKEMTIEAIEFIRRFLLHILPSGFIKIRHYGILSHRNKTKLRSCQTLLGVSKIAKSKEKESWSDLFFRITKKDPSICPVCQKGHMSLKQTLPLQRPSPYLWKKVS
ncbi:MAG: IS91 family transposase [Nitrosopumilaceae archaeon]